MGITLPNPENIARQTPRTPGNLALLNDAQVDSSIGQALSSVGRDAFEFAIREKARMDDIALDDAKNQYFEKSLQLEDEYSQIRGKNAVDKDIVKIYSDKLNGINDDITSNLKNEAQKRAWTSFYKSQSPRFTAGILQHQLTESDRYATETYKATNVTRIQNAQAHWSDPAIVDQSASDITKNITKEKVRVGWGEERIQAEMISNLGPMWAGVTAQLINAKQYPEARKMLAQHQAVIGTDQTLTLSRAIENGEKIGTAQQKSDEILQTVKGEEEQRKAAREIKDPVVRDATLAYIKEYQVEQRQQIIDNQKELKKLHDSEDQAIGDFYTQKNYKAAMNAVQGAKYLTGDERRVWANAIDERSQKESKGPLSSDRIIYSNLLDEIDKNSDKEAVKAQIILQSSFLSDSDYQGLLEKLRTKTNSLESKSEADGRKYIKTQIIPSRGAMASYLSTPKEEEDYYNAVHAFDEAIKDAKAKGEALTTEEINTIAKDTAKQYTKTMVERQNDYMRYMQEQYRTPAETKELTDDEIRKLLKDNGFAVTDENIENFKKQNGM